MTVSVDSPHVLQHEGKPVYFCSSGCKAKFVANPAKYQVARSESNAPTPPAAQRAVDGAIYTCFRCTRRFAKWDQAIAQFAE
jgi:Cu+-exporting ATPase